MGVKIKLVKTSGIMHHKFCIIDKLICLHGSFNWTRNANQRNNEDLSITDENNVINEYIVQFNALWELSKQDIKMLRRPSKCKKCNGEEINICFFEQEGDYQTKMYVIKVCNCGEEKIAEEYFDISVYNNIIGINEAFDDYLEEACQIGDEMDYRLSNYLSNVRQNRLGCDIIHAVGVKGWRWFDKHDGEWYYKIIWKEKYTSTYISDEYDIIDW